MPDVIPLNHYAQAFTLRYLAVTTNDPAVSRVMIVEIDDGAALLFTYGSVFDGGCTSDFWFESVADAVGCVLEEYAVSSTTWFATDDPPIYCQQDWITPVRVPGRESGNPIFGTLQLKVRDEWTEFNPERPPKIEIEYNLMTRLNDAPAAAL